MVYKFGAPESDLEISSSEPESWESKSQMWGIRVQYGSQTLQRETWIWGPDVEYEGLNLRILDSSSRKLSPFRESVPNAPPLLWGPSLGRVGFQY